MNPSTTVQLVIDAITVFGTQALVVLGAIIVIAVSLLIFRWGWKNIARMASDQSLQIGGYYVRKLPYAGYNRFRSKRWNMEHTA